MFAVLLQGQDFGQVDVTFSGVIRAPLFLRGQTSEAEWRAAARNNPAPWAELGSPGKFIMTIPSENARSIDNPEAVVAMWDSVMDAVADLCAVSVLEAA